MASQLFDRRKLSLLPLAQRRSDLDRAAILPLGAGAGAFTNDRLTAVAARLVAAKRRGAALILMTGGHVFRAGVQNYLIDLMERGYVSALATNGSCLIHDFELALIGATTESVAHYIREGQFGLWQETGRINEIVNAAYRQDPASGFGAAVGRAIQEGDFPGKATSVFAAGHRLGVPVTVHVGIGYDIIHEHPNCDGAATGALSYNDFLRFAAVVQKIEGGAVLDFGSAVMAPEVFLKALSMARNVARQDGKPLAHFTALVCDLHELPDNYAQEPSKDSHNYYFRPWKTLLVRTTADGGESFYVQGRHAQTIPALWAAINQAEKTNG